MPNKPCLHGQCCRAHSDASGHVAKAGEERLQKLHIYPSAFILSVNGVWYRVRLVPYSKLAKVHNIMSPEP